MRTRFLLIVVAILSLCTFSSCTKEYYYEMQPDVFMFTVNQNNWNYSNISNNNYFYATVNAPEITADVCERGLVKVYRIFEDNTGSSQVEMPYVHLNEFYVESADQWVFYTETVHYEFEQGKITVIYKASDFDYEIDETFIPENMKFRVVIY